MSDRELVLEAVRKMPDQSSWEDIVGELRLLAAVREGLAESERGEGQSSDKARDLVRQWTSG
ncbi:MAG: hypothetical protein H7A46_11465 [Verrucomicrobiales bacterium]|nr:hypothetical protein [Verrucomicrobiales bacterium]